MALADIADQGHEHVFKRTTGVRLLEHDLDGELAAVLGSPGGDTIPATVAQVLRNLVDHRLTLDAAVERGRVHHQYLPDRVRSEKGRPLPAEVRNALAARGHTIDPNPILMGGANCILIDVASGTSFGWADSRKGGLALGGRRRP